HHLGAFRHFGIGFTHRLRGGGRLLFLAAAGPGVGLGVGLCILLRRFGFGLRRRLLRLRRRRLVGVGGALAIGEDRRDRRVDGDVGRAFGNQNLAERTFVGGLDLHRRLVGLDLGDHVAGLDGLAFLFQPLGKVALF